MELDVSGFDFETTDEEITSVNEELDMEADLAGETAESDLFAGADEVSTKLDLAKAYIDMGDEEGARSTLEEVLAEGNDEQKREAKELMKQMA